MQNKNIVFKKINLIENNVRRLLNNKSITYGLNRVFKRLIKELDLYKNHVQGSREWRNRKRNINTPRKIQIGGGRHLLKGFLNIDINPPADIIFDVREGLPLDSDYAELIFAEHFFEHLDYPVSVKKFIRECYRVLEKSGVLILGVPDSELVIKNYVIKNKKFWKLMAKKWYSKRNFLPHLNTYIDLLNYHFRDQDDDEKYNPHLWAYDYEKLYLLLKNAGFSRIEKWNFDKTIANPERELGTLYIIATK